MIKMNTVRLSSRQKEIIELLKISVEMSVEEIATRFQVTSTTIRRELAYLEENMLIVRSRGHARIAPTSMVSPFSIRCEKNNEEKMLLAQKAMEYIRPNDTIIMDSGTSVYALALQMAHKDIKDMVIVTNSVPIVNVLAGKCRIMVCGGMLEESTMSLLGSNADTTIDSVVADKLFIGAAGIKINVGLTITSPLQYSIKTKMLKSVEESFVMVDSSKFKTMGVNIFCRWADVGTIITVRNEENADIIEKMQRSGVRIDYVDRLKKD
jgi:DeoR/GlpR family transcriptional regulator of sugar metabolism